MYVFKSIAKLSSNTLLVIYRFNISAVDCLKFHSISGRNKERRKRNWFGKFTFVGSVEGKTDGKPFGFSFYIVLKLCM